MSETKFVFCENCKRVFEMDAVSHINECPACDVPNPMPEIPECVASELARRDEKIEELQFQLDSLCLCWSNPQDEHYLLVDEMCPIHGHPNREIARRDEELKITDGMLKEVTETIGAVVACCTYNSNDDAKIGIYGIDQKAFTMIDQFITHYNDAVSAGKVSVDVKPVKRENDYQNDNRTNTGG